MTIHDILHFGALAIAGAVFLITVGAAWSAGSAAGRR